jgi:hypothetical protein
MIWLSILVLVLGVGVLSSKKPEVIAKKVNIGEEDEEADVEANSKGTESFSLPTLSKDRRQSEAAEWSMNKDSLESDRSEDVDVEKLKRPRANTDDFGSFVGESAPILSPREDGDGRS